MTRVMVLLSVIVMCMPGCYRYNTHKGRVGGSQSPSPLPAPQPDIPAVQFGSVPTSTIPDLIAPITRTVWIKGHKRPNGDYVGDYPLTCVFQKGEFVTHTPANVLIPHAIRVPDETQKTSAAGNPVQHGVGTTGVSPAAIGAAPQQIPSVQDYFKALQGTASEAGKGIGP